METVVVVRRQERQQKTLQAASDVCATIPMGLSVLWN